MQLGDDVRAFLEEERCRVLGTVNSDGSPQQTVMWYEFGLQERITLLLHVGRVDVHGFEGEE